MAVLLQHGALHCICCISGLMLVFLSLGRTCHSSKRKRFSVGDSQVLQNVGQVGAVAAQGGLGRRPRGGCRGVRGGLQQDLLS